MNARKIRVAFERLSEELDRRGAREDTDDIRTLYRLCGFRTAAEGLDLVEAVYPGRPVAPRTRFLLEELFGPA